MNKKSFKRFWEIDVLRGIAIVMMIVFHFLYDLNYFNIYRLSLYSGYFLIYVYLIGIFFFLLVGISLTLSYNTVKENLSIRQIQLKYIFRGLKIFCLGLLITLISFVILEEGYIIFGVLHCIGISIILAYPFLNFRYLNALIGFFLIFIGLILKNFTFDFIYLVWLGVKPAQFYTIDYFPLLPWFGVVLIGIFIGNILYPKHNRSFILKDLSGIKTIRFFSFLGRHALIIYFIHQPILLTVIYFFSNF